MISGYVVPGDIFSLGINSKIVVDYFLFFEDFINFAAEIRFDFADMTMDIAIIPIETTFNNEKLDYNALRKASSI